MTNILKTIQSLNGLKRIQLIERRFRLLPSLSTMSSRSKSSVEAESTGTGVSGLPPLPIPSLQQTMERLRTSAQPFAKSAQELEDLNQIINEFSKVNGIGAKLHSLLEHKSSQTVNWLSHDWWMDKAYLEGRDPVMIWSNPGLVYPDLQILKTPNKSFVIQFISRLILSLIDFRNSLKSGINPELSAKDATKGVPPICMDQYNKIFGTCRKPGNPVDSIRLGSLDTNEMTIIISRLNRFYKLRLTLTNKEVLLSTIQSAIVGIMSEKTSETIPFGSFSALPRNDFSTVYQLLDENALNSITESEFVVNIDQIEDFNSLEDNESYYKRMAKQSLHSDLDNIGNRWFDKTIQLIVVLNKSADRVIGSAFCYEHTPAEGGVVVKLMEHSIKQLISDKTHFASQPVEVNVEELSLVSKANVDKVKASAEFAKEKYLNFINSIDLEVLEFRDYGKEFVKSAKCSPDSWIQLAIALAFYRLHGKVGATYESGGTRKFALGRTECIRSVSNEFLQFFKCPNIQTLNNAIESHRNLTKNAVNGHGIDRILLGYNCSAQEVQNGLWKWGLSRFVIDNPLTQTDYQTLKTLYTNDLYLRSKHFHMSTSQVASSVPQAFMCYGPLVYDGYGCCYNPSKDQILFAISAFKQNNGNTSALGYKTELNNSLQLMKQTVMKTSKL